MSGRERFRAEVHGVVQGVGFRPFVYNLALDLGLSGWVENNASGVELAVQGAEEPVAEFFRRLEGEAPPLAIIQLVERRREEPEPVAENPCFAIRPSKPGLRRTLISPDAKVCDACLAEMRDPADRRFGYPFINCTHCGPRYTIIKDIPYDRPFTTMAPFEMCAKCRAEYEDPANRRFHAQPNACPECGPRLWLADAGGKELPGDPIEKAAQALSQGQVVAIKGLGGFHLAADPFNRQAVAALRGRKHREEKPLALMVASLEEAAKLAFLEKADLAALDSRERPIVLATARPDTGLAPEVAPRNRLLGLMLPYTPLHHLLMDQGFAALVMTSGNVSDEPICLDNREACARIGAAAERGAIADFFLMHNRDIQVRGDDSVVRVVGGALRQIRRSRGFAPAPILLPQGAVTDHGPPVLAVGAHLKNTLCLLRGRQAFLSQHVGDLDNLTTLEFFEQTADHLVRILETQPKIIASDLHPDYQSTRWAQGRGLPLVRVQHHHAHIAAVMAEHGISRPVVGLALDGTGFGPDGTVWGGELLYAGLTGYRRLGRIAPLALPGGEAAVKQPWRVGLGLLIAAFGEQARDLPLPLVLHHAGEFDLIASMIKKGINTPWCSSLGRLFDGVAAIAGLRESVAYEGQAAVELEQAMDPAQAGEAAYPLEFSPQGGLWEIDCLEMVRRVAADTIAGDPLGGISARFHRTILSGLARWAGAAAEAMQVEAVCAAGGCLMNAYLLEGLPPLLQAQGLTAHTPALAPANDGGLSLGQAAIAAAVAERGLLTGDETVIGEGDF